MGDLTNTHTRLLAERFVLLKRSNKNMFSVFQLARNFELPLAKGVGKRESSWNLFCSSFALAPAPAAWPSHRWAAIVQSRPAF